MSGLDFHLFGAPRIARDGAAVTVERRKALALLAYLAVTRQAHGREALATLLWPEADSERGRAGLRRALVDLNAALGKGWVEAEGDQIALRADAGLQVDVGRFHAALARVAAHSHPPHRLCDACLADLTEAASIYTADFLAGFTLADAADFDEWQGFQTESLRLELAGALEKLAIGLAGRQEYAAALPHARRWLALDPLHEPAHRLLMQLHAQAGDRAAALRQYGECGKVLQAELGIEPEPETKALYEAIRSGTTGEAAPGLSRVPAPAPAHNLPTDPTPFIGRTADLTQITARLADPACHLLTILGPGGMGKTRLAIQAARGQTDVFSHGVFFVDLAPVTSAELLAAAILQALPGTAQAAGDAQTQLFRYLRDKHVLLVLDNFEQLAEGGAELLPKLLAAAPKVKLLVTSRARLNLREEWLAPLEGMRTPGDVEREAQEHEDTKEPHCGAGEAREARRVPSDERESSRFAPFASLRDFAIQTSTLEHYSATALFLACMRRVRPGFQPSDADARHIVHICRLLEGIPLAIELAAARIRALPLGKLAQELEHGLQLLSTGLRDVPQRHRSMTAAFDHSWRLLAPRQQSILRQLSIFRGGCTTEAAEAVTGATVDDLQELADASWLRLSSAGRYELHELARQYGIERLASEHTFQTRETVNQVRDRHASYFASILRAYVPHLNRNPGELSQLVGEVDNLLAALDWMVARNDLDMIWAMLMGLWTVAVTPGRYQIVLEALEASLRKLRGAHDDGQAAPDRPDARNLVCAQILIVEGSLLRILGQWQRRENCLEEAAKVLGQADTEDIWWRETDWHLRSGVVLTKLAQGDHVGAIRILEMLLADLLTGRVRLWPYREDSTWGFQADICIDMAIHALWLGQYEEARRHTAQGLVFAEKTGSEAYKAWCMQQMFRNLICTGDFSEAEKCGLTALKTYRALKYHTTALNCMWHLGRLYVAWGRYDQARAYCRRNLALARTLGHYGMYTGSLYVLAEAELGSGNVARARLLCEEALARSERPESADAGHIANSLIGLGEVMLSSNDPQMASGHFERVLRMSLGSFSSIVSARAISGLMRVLLAQGQLERAAELCGFLLGWPVSTYTVKQQAEKVVQILETQLSPEIFAAAVARGRSRQIDDVVAELISEPARQAADDTAALI